jgi:formate hydrogenlyase subunit 3/multisubunit Na+/H+ antiporter MnhD subunit
MASAAFIVAAIVVALIRAIVPFPHGWWLVAYLLLVGALAQVLLGSGTATSAGGRRLDARFWLWNAGTVAVAVGDPLGAPAAVLAGSVALLAALALFASDAARRAAYLLLIIFMAGSVLVGCFLGRAFPWQ